MSAHPSRRVAAQAARRGVADGDRCTFAACRRIWSKPLHLPFRFTAHAFGPRGNSSALRASRHICLPPVRFGRCIDGRSPGFFSAFPGWMRSLPDRLPEIRRLCNECSGSSGRGALLVYTNWCFDVQDTSLLEVFQLSLHKRPISGIVFPGTGCGWAPRFGRPASRARGRRTGAARAWPS